MSENYIYINTIIFSLKFIIPLHYSIFDTSLQYTTSLLFKDLSKQSKYSCPEMTSLLPPSPDTSLNALIANRKSLRLPSHSQLLARQVLPFYLKVFFAELETQLLGEKMILPHGFPLTTCFDFSTFLSMDFHDAGYVRGHTECHRIYC